jgi:hypothetical protein
LNPMARIAARVVVGSDPELMLDAPIPATQQGPGKSRLDHRPDGRDRDQRGFRFSSPLPGLKSRAGHGTREPKRRRHCPGTPAGRFGRGLNDQAGARASANRWDSMVCRAMCIGHGMATGTIVERIEMPEKRGMPVLLTVYLSLGTNLGDPVHQPEECPGSPNRRQYNLEALSKIYQTPPWGYDRPA